MGQSAGINLFNIKNQTVNYYDKETPMESNFSANLHNICRLFEIVNKFIYIDLEAIKNNPKTKSRYWTWDEGYWQLRHEGRDKMRMAYHIGPNICNAMPYIRTIKELQYKNHNTPYYWNMAEGFVWRDFYGSIPPNLTIIYDEHFRGKLHLSILYSRVMLPTSYIQDCYSDYDSFWIKYTDGHEERINGADIVPRTKQIADDLKRLAGIRPDYYVNWHYESQGEAKDGYGYTMNGHWVVTDNGRYRACQWDESYGTNVPEGQSVSINNIYI